MRHFTSMGSNSNACVRTKDRISQRNNKRIQQLLRLITHSRYSILGRIVSTRWSNLFLLPCSVFFSVYFTCLAQTMFLTLTF